MKFSNSDIEGLLRPYGVALKSGVSGRIATYISLLLKWNRAISLTTVTDPAEIVKFHFGESIFSAAAVKFDESRLADVGSGAGFPGLPLAIALPRLNVTLIESNTKKCAFLSEVVRELRIPNVTVFRGRMEEFPLKEPLNFIVARALGKHDELLSWAKAHLTASGKVVLWLGESDSIEISHVPDWRWESAELIPGSVRRYLLVGSPKS
jgi:16S rRNA (guanine527-N7)-methyltransferase